MATVWELIQEHSTAPPGSTFWEHLNAQEGGGSGVGVILYDGLEVEIDMACYELEVEVIEYELEIEPIAFELEIETTEFELEICDA